MEIQDRFLDLMFPYMNVRESLYSLLCRTIGKLLKSTKILPTMFPAIKSKPTLLQNNRHINNPRCKTKHFFLEDIALITLKKGFTLSHKINPACVPLKPHFKDIIGQKIQVAGWGRCNASLGVSPDILQHAELQVMSHEECLRKYIKNKPIVRFFQSQILPRRTFR